MSEESPQVGVLLASPSELQVLQQTGAMLEKFGIPHEIRVMSALRNPDLVDEYARTAEDRGIQVIVCGGGLSGHLAGAVAARTVLPVIGVPISSKHHGGAEALYSTAQMPSGVPVATVAIDGAVNAAILAAQIVGVRDEEVRRRLRKFKDDLAEGLKL
jgi:5-(carboxyamino)imidazole ribonucleotide mutase